MTNEMGDYVPGSAMVVVAHPDDAEFMVAGTVAKWTALGCEVTYVIITKGDKGSEDRTMRPSRLAEIREEEQRAAGKTLGVQNFEFMGYPDGYLEHTIELRRDLTRLIRKYRPELIVCFDPRTRFFGDMYPNHPDHRASGDATIDAVFPSARDHLTFPELLADGYDTHKVAELWLSAAERPNVWVDITDTFEKKKEALLAHPSQLGEDVADFATEMARQAAEGRDFEFAEAFWRVQLERPDQVFKDNV